MKIAILFVLVAAIGLATYYIHQDPEAFLQDSELDRGFTVDFLMWLKANGYD